MTKLANALAGGPLKMQINKFSGPQEPSYDRDLPYQYLPPEDVSNPGKEAGSRLTEQLNHVLRSRIEIPQFRQPENDAELMKNVLDGTQRGFIEPKAVMPLIDMWNRVYPEGAIDPAWLSN